MTMAQMFVILAAFSYWGRNVPPDDKNTAECHEYVLDSLANADMVGKINIVTDKNLRDQMTLSDALELYEEARLTQMGAERN